MSENIVQKLFQPSERGKIWRIFLLIIILVVIGGLIDAGNYYNRGTDWVAEKTGYSIKLPKTKEVPFKFGLDLLGGSHLVYRADMSGIPDGDKSTALEGVRDVIERRINVFGVSEPLIQTNISGGEYRVIAELAGIKDVNEAIKMIGETPLLEFKEQVDKLRDLTEEEKAQMDEVNKKADEKSAEVLKKLAAGEDFAALAREYSEDSATKDNGGSFGWVTEKENSDIVQEIKNLKPGEYTKSLVFASNGYEIIKLDEKRKRSNPFNESETEKEVKASHILVCYEGKNLCESGFTQEEALAKINEVKAKANINNFAELAKEYSTGPSAPSGGDLGWFDRSSMVKPFSDVVFGQAKNTISDVVETDFGYHIILKQDERDIEEYNISHIFFQTITEKDIIGDQKDWVNTELTGKNLDRAMVQFDPNTNNPEVGLEFDSEGADMFAEITERNVGKPLAIFLDNYPISIPTVNTKITGGKAVISGSFNIQEAKLLAQRLNAGALPVPIELINQQTVGATLGHASMEDSLRAGIAGLLLVALFMLLFYRVPGIIAVISLIIYGLLTLAVFKIFSVTLTLAGLAGFILSIGMAVDANVLIFERLKEELRTNKPLGLAIGDSFDRAWPSIRDGNVSTLLTCLILIWFSTSIVKGFAITLFLGVCISMFSAIIVTKTLLQLLGGEWMEKRKWLIGVRKK